MPEIAGRGRLGCPYYSVEDEQVEWCDLDPVTPHHDEKVIDGETAVTEPHVVDTLRIRPDDDGRKSNFWGDVRLLLLSDGTVRWSHDD